MALPQLKGQQMQRHYTFLPILPVIQLQMYKEIPEIDEVIVTKVLGDFYSTEKNANFQYKDWLQQAENRNVFR